MFNPIEIDNDDLCLDTFVTKGKNPGRVIQCQEPYIQGDNLFYDGHDLDLWYFLDAEPPLNDAELQEIISEIVKARRDAVFKFVEENPEYIVIEETSGWLELMHKNEAPQN